jgi:hypothetical protein
MSDQPTAGPFTPEQEARIRELIAQMSGNAPASLVEVGRMSRETADELIDDYVSRFPDLAAKLFGRGATGADFLAAPIEAQHRVLDVAVPPDVLPPASPATERKTPRGVLRYIRQMLLAFLQGAVPTLREPAPKQPPYRRVRGHD